MRLTRERAEKGIGGADQSTYARSDICGIVHLGTGAFHKAHQAVYFDRLMELGETGWMIQGASLRRPVAANQLNPQDGLFTLAERDGEKTSYRIIRSIKKVIQATSDPISLVDALGDPSTVLVTLTITEKGYCLDPTTGALNLDDPAVKADLKDLSCPQTAPGYLAAGLAKRRSEGLKPYTVLSCDNIPENGVRTRRAVLEIAQAIDSELARWIETEGAFPSSMVDRIVPATTIEDVKALEARLGIRDEAMVKTEPFNQWVVEDRFCNIRPSLDRVGVQFTDTIAPFEQAKLRLLNAAHSALAYLGPLAGHDYVHDAIAAPGFEALIDAIWDEAETTLEPNDDLDISEYRGQLKARFQNAALMHKTRQIAIDGSQKIPQRFLHSMIERRQQGLSSPALSLALAGWMRWQIGEDENGASYKVDDPLSEKLGQIARRVGKDASALSAGLLAISEVFPVQLANDEKFCAELRQSLAKLFESGTAETVREFT